MAATKSALKTTPVTAKNAPAKAAPVKNLATPSVTAKSVKPENKAAVHSEKEAGRHAPAPIPAAKKGILTGVPKNEKDKMTKKTVDTKSEIKTDAKPAKKTKAVPVQPEPAAENNAAPEAEHQASSNGAEAKNSRQATSKKDETAEPKKGSSKSSKVSIKYDPDFTRSVLDSNYLPVEPTNSANRYNDSDLVEFRELINRKLESSKKELAYLQGVITRKDETGGDNDDARYMTMEDGSLSMEREQLSQMASRQITYIDHLEKALIRIENKTYGICRVTGKLIDKARLRAVPHATLSVEAKMGKVKA